MAFSGQEEHPGELGVGSAPHDASSSSGNGAGAQVGRYQECLRNHAAALGGHVVDGCGEFMPGDDAAHALRCAACGCHRSFHRVDDGQHHHQQHHRFPAPVLTTPRVPLHMPPPPPYAASHPHAPPPFLYHHQQQQRQHTPSGGTATESSSEERGPGPPSTSAPAQRQGQKRFRTRFTAEQKEQMLALAERVGWRMQRQDDALVDHHCALAGVRRQVFKVWMHNNKHHHHNRRQEQRSQERQED